jgi:hypothetical protein
MKCTLVRHYSLCALLFCFAELHASALAEWYTVLRQFYKVSLCSCFVFCEGD